MTIKDVTVYVKESRRVSYSYKTVWQILSEKEKEGQVWQPVHKEQQEA